MNLKNVALKTGKWVLVIIAVLLALIVIIRLSFETSIVQNAARQKISDVVSERFDGGFLQISEFGVDGIFTIVLKKMSFLIENEKIASVEEASLKPNLSLSKPLRARVNLSTVYASVAPETIELLKKSYVPAEKKEESKPPDFRVDATIKDLTIDHGFSLAQRVFLKNVEGMFSVTEENGQVAKLEANWNGESYLNGEYSKKDESEEASLKTFLNSDEILKEHPNLELTLDANLKNKELSFKTFVFEDHEVRWNQTKPIVLKFDDSGIIQASGEMKAPHSLIRLTTEPLLWNVILDKIALRDLPTLQEKTTVDAALAGKIVSSKRGEVFHARIATDYLKFKGKNVGTIQLKSDGDKDTIAFNVLGTIGEFKLDSKGVFQKEKKLFNVNMHAGGKISSFRHLLVSPLPTSISDSTLEMHAVVKGSSENPHLNFNSQLTQVVLPQLGSAQAELMLEGNLYREVTFLFDVKSKKGNSRAIGKLNPVTGKTLSLVDRYYHPGLRLKSDINMEMRPSESQHFQMLSKLGGTLGSPELTSDLFGARLERLWPVRLSLKFKNDLASLGLVETNEKKQRALITASIPWQRQVTERNFDWDWKTSHLGGWFSWTNLNLYGFSSFFEAVDKLRGNVVTDLKFSGTLGDPALHGTLKVSKFECDIPGVRGIRNGNLALIFGGQNLKMSEFSWESGGKFNADGEIDWSDNIIGNTNINLKEFFPNPTLFPHAWVDLKTNITFNNNADVMKVVTNIEKLKITAEKLSAPKRVISTKPSDFVVIESDLEATEERQKPSMPIDLRVNTVEAIEVVTPDSRLFFNVKFTLNRNENDERAGGYIRQAKDSRINLFGKDLQLRNVGVTFRNRPLSRGTLHGRVTHESDGARLFVNLEGTVNKPETVLSSVPPMTDAQIMSSLLGMKESDPVFEEEGKKTAQSVKSQAGSILANAAIREVGSYLNIPFRPVVSLNTVEDMTGERNTLDVGNYVSDKLYVGYERVYGSSLEAPSNQLKIQYDINERVILQTQIGDSQDGKLDILWKRRF